LGWLLSWVCLSVDFLRRKKFAFGVLDCKSEDHSTAPRRPPSPTARAPYGRRLRSTCTAHDRRLRAASRGRGSHRTAHAQLGRGGRHRLPRPPAHPQLRQLHRRSDQQPTCLPPRRRRHHRLLHPMGQRPARPRLPTRPHPRHARTHTSRPGRHASSSHGMACVYCHLHTQQLTRPVSGQPPNGGPFQNSLKLARIITDPPLPRASLPRTGARQVHLPR
jgi:hypothetical protein